MYIFRFQEFFKQRKVYQMIKRIPVIFIALVFSFTCLSREYHVAKTGNDSNKGTKESPFLTIQAAAYIAHPGDVIIVHEGVYRERVNPPRGGTSDDMRIVYQAAEGEEACKSRQLAHYH